MHTIKIDEISLKYVSEIEMSRLRSLMRACVKSFDVVSTPTINVEYNADEKSFTIDFVF